jgi:hypothetical protein
MRHQHRRHPHGRPSLRPTTGRFLSVDPVPGVSLNNYDYAGQDPVNGYDLNGESACSRNGWFTWSHLCGAGRAGVKLTAFLIYAPYYAIHYAGRRTHDLIFVSPDGVMLLSLEALSLGGDVGFDWLKEHLGYKEHLCDEGPGNSFNPFHGKKRGKRFLPGCRIVGGHIHIDYP